MIKALSTLLTIHNCKSIRRAAEILHTDPTAVSRQVRSLEHEFGTELIVRSSRGVKLTDAGVLLVQQATSTLRDLEAVRNRIADLKGLQTGRVRIYTAEAAIDKIVAPSIAELGEQYPKVAIHVVVAGADETYEALRSGDADIGITLFLDEQPDIEIAGTAQVENVAVCSPDHPLAAQTSCGIADLVRYPLALADTSFNARQAFERVIKALKMRYEPQITTSSLAVKKVLALSGKSVVLIPRMSIAAEQASGLLVAVPILESALGSLPLVIAVKKGQTVTFAAQKYLDSLIAGVAKLPDGQAGFGGRQPLVPDRISD